MMFYQKAKLQSSTLESALILDVSKYASHLKHERNTKHVIQKVVFGVKKQFIQVEIFDVEKKLNFIHNHESLMRTIDLIAGFHALDSFVLGFSLKNGYEKTDFLCNKIYKNHLKHPKKQSNIPEQYKNYIITNYSEGYFINYIKQSSDALRILTSKDIYLNSNTLINMGSVNAFHLGYITRA